MDSVYDYLHLMNSIKRPLNFIPANTAFNSQRRRESFEYVLDKLFKLGIIVKYINKQTFEFQINGIDYQIFDELNDVDITVFDQTHPAFSEYDEDPYIELYDNFFVTNYGSYVKSYSYIDTKDETVSLAKSLINRYKHVDIFRKDIRLLYCIKIYARTDKKFTINAHGKRNTFDNLDDMYHYIDTTYSECCK